MEQFQVGADPPVTAMPPQVTVAAEPFMWPEEEVSPKLRARSRKRPRRIRRVRQVLGVGAAAGRIRPLAPGSLRRRAGLVGRAAMAERAVGLPGGPVAGGAGSGRRAMAFSPGQAGDQWQLVHTQEPETSAPGTSVQRPHPTSISTIPFTCSAGVAIFVPSRVVTAPWHCVHERRVCLKCEPEVAGLAWHVPQATWDPSILVQIGDLFAPAEGSVPP